MTHLQLFGIGFGFAMAGPCLVACAPVLIAYLAGRQGAWRESLGEIVVFLCGRLTAYLLLGAAAGLSGQLLARLTAGRQPFPLHAIAGLISIVLALVVLRSSRQRRDGCAGAPCGILARRLAAGGLFAFGFLAGIAPCAPLVGLLFEIALMSRSLADGCLYALSFGVGTCIASLIVMSVMAGLVSWIPVRIVRSARLRALLRLCAAALLIILGIGLMAQDSALFPRIRGAA